MKQKLIRTIKSYHQLKLINLKDPQGNLDEKDSNVETRRIMVVGE